ncbi:MAG: serine hydroxymethyltransferase [Patescibacteria group bacterium]|jgi:glycine hydroxymethyltransferase
MQHLKSKDPIIAGLIAAELARQQHGLEMIPSENFTSLAVIEALGSVLTNKYSEGYPGRRYYGGNSIIDEIEELARSRAKELFGVAHANVQPYSGSPANQACFFALLNPGDTVLGMELGHGGHLTHGYGLNFSGRYYKSVSYGVNKETELLDYDAIRAIAKRERPKLIVCGATAYPRKIDFAAFKAIADEVNAYLLADISHITGLIIAGVHDSPVPYADLVMTTTHKTLRGPRGAIILVPRLTDRLAEHYERAKTKTLDTLVDSAIIPGLQGGPHNHQTAAIAVALAEAATDDFKTYGRQIVKNAAALAETITTAGVRLVTGGTDNHLLLIDVTPVGLTGKEAEEALDSVGITVNKNMIPFDTRKPLDPSGIRLGTPALTSRGFTEKDMQRVGECIANILRRPTDEAVREKVKRTVAELTTLHPLYPEL